MSFEMTDAGNAQRFAHKFRDRFRYVPEYGTWLEFDGKRWSTDTLGAYMEGAKQISRDILHEAAVCVQDEVRNALGKWALKSQEHARIAAIPKLAKTDRAFAVSAEHLDSDPWLLNVDNGTLDLRNGALRLHDPSDLITKLAPVPFNPTADAQLFIRFAGRTFCDRAPLISYVQRLLGMCLTGDISEQIFPIFHGGGANGKSTLLGTVQELMGDYAGSAPDSLLTLNQHQEHPTEVADLQGKRLVVASETEAHARLRTQLIKKITGESTIKARRMYGNYFEFRRTSKIFLQTNNKPLIREDTEAVWRRIHLVPFMATIPAAERDPRLMERLREEAPGILAWLVRGCLEWQHAGLQPPQEVAEATRSYREESDPLADFINDCCAIDPDFVTATGELRRAYEAYCTEKGMRPVGGRTFAERLQQLQCTADRNASGRFWRGIALVDTAANFMGCHVED